MSNQFMRGVLAAAIAGVLGFAGASIASASVFF